ncbi:MAG TPA: hypothetical protein VMS02_00375 [Solirubrobacteraceae bacterium]|nr:hypothetical protein [Solirubrobacteraceae bacterium]
MRARDSPARPARATRAPGARAAAAGLAAPALVVLLLAWPLLFTNATFNEDWLNHLWYLWHQSRALRADGHPSLFLDYSGGVLYPIYAFYGGTLYVLGGALALLLGDAPLRAYLLSYLLGFAAAYGGWYWLARMFGLARPLAHIPGLVFVTSAYYLTMIYGLGDWPEFIATSTLPLLIASGLSVLRAPRLRGWPAFALAASAVVFFGSHLLSAIWGATVLALVGLALLAYVPAARVGLTRAGALRVAGLVLAALLVNAWFLLPTVAYESQTVIANAYPHFRELLRTSAYTVSAKNLFTLSRAHASGTVLVLALPVLAIGWVLVSLALSLREGRRGTWLRVLLVLAGATCALTLAMTHPGILLALPRAYSTLQFGFRLESLVLMGISGALLAALALAAQPAAVAPRGPARSRASAAHTRRTGTRTSTEAGPGGGWGTKWRWALAPIAALSLAGAAQQVSAHPQSRSRATATSSYLAPVFEQEGLLDYVDDNLPIWRRTLPQVTFPPGALRGESATEVVRAAPGGLVDSNLRAGPDLVHVTGARIVATDAQADDVLRIDRQQGDAAGPATVSIAPAHTLPIVLGGALSVLGLLALALQFLRIPLLHLRPVRQSAIYRATIKALNDRS